MLSCLVKESLNESCSGLCIVSPSVVKLEGEPFHPNIKAYSNMHCLWLASETCQNVRSAKHGEKQAADFHKMLCL